MLTAKDLQNHVEPALANLDFGKQYLLSALNSGDRQLFLSALHNIMDVICQELESG